MGALGYIAAIFTRILFAAHAGFVVWMVVRYHAGQLVYWSLCTGLFCLAVELIFTIILRKGQEFRCVWPSCFFYLCTVVPCTWIIELDLLDDRITKSKSATITVSGIQMSEDFSRKFCEVGLMLIIIAGRWMLPRGSITRDQLSALLLEYVAIAADILELFGAFEEDQVKLNRSVIIATLVVYSWSLLQFTFSSTAISDLKEEKEAETKEEIEEMSDVGPELIPFAPRKYLRKLVLMEQTKNVNRYRLDSSKRSKSTVSVNLTEEEQEHQMKKMELHGDVFGIMAGILMQDGPFLAMRIYLIAIQGIKGEMQYFFAGKNAVTLALLMYRLYAVQSTREEDEITPYERFRHVSIAVFSATHMSKGKKSDSSTHRDVKITDTNGNTEAKGTQPSKPLHRKGKHTSPEALA